MIINKKGFRCSLIKKKIENYMVKTILKNFSITKINIDNNFIEDRLKINPQQEKIKIEITLNNLKNKKLQLNLFQAEDRLKQPNTDDKRKESDLMFDKFFNVETNKEDNKLIFSNKNCEYLAMENDEDDFQINLTTNKSLIFNVKMSSNIQINANQLTDKNANIAFENSNNFELLCEEAKINISNSLVYSNIIINAKNSEIKFDGLYAYRRKPFTNFKLFEESFIKANQIKSMKENYSNENDVLQSGSDINDNKELKIISENSKVDIENIKNFNKFSLRTTEKSNEEKENIEKLNSLNINNIEVRNFDIELNNKNDKLNININHLFENSIFKMRNIDFKNVNIKMHPVLLFNLNVYNTNKGKFQKFLMFENEGYSFCPTVVFDIDKEFPKNYLIGFELIKINKNFKRFVYLLIAMFFTKIIFLSDNSLDNCREYETSFNTLENLPRQISEYKFYQLAMKKKFDKLLENIDK